MNELALDFYMKILMTMALILFISNQVLILYRGLHEDWIVHRIRKKIKERKSSGQAPPKVLQPRSAKQKHEWKMSKFKMPDFNMNLIWGSFGVLVVILLLSAAAYILLVYNPSPGK